jgi:hypothetical protein
MIDTAIAVCPQDGLREEALLGLDLERFGGQLRGQGQLQVVPPATSPARRCLASQDRFW